MPQLQFYDVAKALAKNCTFNVIIGGRGIGKTYSALDKARNNKFVFLKRHRTEMQACANEIGNPFKKLNSDKGYNVQVKYSDKTGLGYFYEPIDDIEKTIGYGIAVSAVAGARGLDFSDTNWIIWDEFIPETHKPYLRDEGTAFLNLYETINRNRELFGQEPVKVLLLSNSTRLDSPVLQSLGIINTIEHMVKIGQECYTDRERSLHVVVLQEHAIGTAKKTTALYKLVGDGEFSEHSIGNKFINDDFSNIATRNMKEYIPLMRVCELYFYIHKSTDRLYVNRSKSDCKINYNKSDLPKFRLDFGIKIRNADINGIIDYCDYETKLILRSFFLPN